MRSSTSWSLTLAKWDRFTIRVHLSFLLFAAFALYLSWSEGVGKGQGNYTWIALTGLAVLLVSVILHECGHIVAVMRCGGEPYDMVVWPLGGLPPVRPPLDHRQELAVQLAGPLVNAILCVAGAIAVRSLGGQDVLGLLHPLAPRGLVDSTADIPLQAARFLCWINGVMWLANLLPAFPFDGGRAIREAVMASRPDLDPVKAVWVVTCLARVVAIALVALSVLYWSDKSNAVVPIWFSLILLAMLLYFSARHEEDRVEESPSDGVFGYDFSQGYTSLENSAPVRVAQTGVIRKWLEDRRQQRLEQQRQQELEDDRRVDEILERLHERGMEGLSSDERLLLERVSQRYRHRQDRS